MNATTKPDLLAPIRTVVNAHKAAQLIDECTEILKADAARAAHLKERSGALEADLENTGDWHTPYKPTEVELPCGCVARLVKDTDGDSVWKEWKWVKWCPTALYGEMK